MEPGQATGSIAEGPTERERKEQARREEEEGGRGERAER
jgi:hypothetical protein